MISGRSRKKMLAGVRPCVRYPRAVRAVEGEGCPRKHPLHQIVRDNAMLVRHFARDLGFLPSAREGLHAIDSGDTDALTEWLSR